MIEAVENHMPEVIVIDEIGSEAEALAAATIAQRGVQLVATAHGECLENILNNPTLQSLLGGVERCVPYAPAFYSRQSCVLGQMEILIAFGGVKSRQKHDICSQWRIQ